MERQVQEVLVLLHLLEYIGLEDVRSQQVQKLDAKALRVENYIFIEFSCLTTVIWRDLHPELAVLYIIIVVQHKETVPLNNLPS